jgi:hypothetical protein
MITLPALAAEALGSFLASDIKDRFGSSHARLAELIPFAARLALECIGNSDALYHNVEHTMLVTLVGHDIFKGRALSQRSTPTDYANFIVACLTHDIGYVRGVVKGDKDDGYVVDGGGRKISLPRGSSDAALAPYHVERSKLFVLDRRWIRVRANMNLGAYASPECFAPRNVLHGRAVVPWLPPVVVAIKRAECGVP